MGGCLFWYVLITVIPADDKLAYNLRCTKHILPDRFAQVARHGPRYTNGLDA